MDISISVPAVLVATLVGFLTSFLYFNQNTFFPVWWRAIGKEGQQPGSGGLPMGAIFGSALVSVLAQALVLGLLADVWTRAYGDLSPASGAFLGLVLGVVAVGASLGHRLFGGHGFTVWGIESGADVLVLVLMGATFGFLA